MNYETARKLKEAGFPQEGHDWFCDEGNVFVCEGEWAERTYYKKDCVAPTLGELIEKCGDKFFDLRRYGEDWAAISNLTFEGLFDPDISFYRSGSTPEEAVANLYLALHPSE